MKTLNGYTAERLITYYLSEGPSTSKVFLQKIAKLLPDFSLGPYGLEYTGRDITYKVQAVLQSLGFTIFHRTKYRIVYGHKDNSNIEARLSFQPSYPDTQNTIITLSIEDRSPIK